MKHILFLCQVDLLIHECNLPATKNNRDAVSYIMFIQKNDLEAIKRLLTTEASIVSVLDKFQEDTSSLFSEDEDVFLHKLKDQTICSKVSKRNFKGFHKLQI